MSAVLRGGRGAWVLEVQGRRVELREGETTLGRSRGCGVVVKDPAVSRDHALLWVRGDTVTVQDLRSSNGTYLNSARLAAETPMTEGDRLTVGETQAYLRFLCDDGRSPQHPAPAAIAAPVDALPEAPTPPPVSAAVALEPAGFWTRAAAFALDGLAVVVGASVLALPLGGPFTPRGRLLAWVLGVVLALFMPLTGWCLWGTTPGKRALGLAVHGPDGRAGLPVARAVLRLAGYALSALPLGAGFWMAAWSPTRRALHDRLAGTAVLRERPTAVARGLQVD